LIRGSKVTAIPLGIDLDRFRPDAQSRQAIREELGMADHELLLVAAGHLGSEKGIDLVLEAVALAIRGEPRLEARLAVMGTGAPDRIALVHQIGHERLGNRVAFLGQRSDPERVFAAADLVVHTPRLEAFGLVVVQAMACGAAVVASRVGGIPEIVVDGETGLLASPEDPPATASLIRSVLESVPRRNALAAAGLARARAEYSAEQFATRHRALYQAILRDN
jgi:glycosyltransferase involved in cell wall biosynthesis